MPSAHVTDIAVRGPGRERCGTDLLATDRADHTPLGQGIGAPAASTPAGPTPAGRTGLATGASVDPITIGRPTPARRIALRNGARVGRIIPPCGTRVTGTAVERRGPLAVERGHPPVTVGEPGGRAGPGGLTPPVAEHLLGPFGGTPQPTRRTGA